MGPLALLDLVLGGAGYYALSLGQDFIASLLFLVAIITGVWTMELWFRGVEERYSNRFDQYRRKENRRGP